MFLSRLILLGLIAFLLAPLALPAPRKSVSADTVSRQNTLGIAYLSQKSVDPPVALYFMAPPPADRGIQGARLGVKDNNTTGRFTGQSFELKEMNVPLNGDIFQAFKQLLAEGYRHVLIDLPGTQAGELARIPEAQNALLYNIGSRDDRLRGELCAANLLHLLPNRAMYTDALAQYLSKKRWQRVFLVTGPNDEDQLFSTAFRRAAQRFGLKLVQEKTWQYRFEERRTPEAEVPVFTQDKEYDVVVIADERGEFGDYFPYRIWLPRPVLGTVGLSPTTWHITHEQWGAIQLQKRFHEQAGRWMSEEDYAAWLAVRAIGEAASRSRSLDFVLLRNYMLSETFALAGFKGVPLSFRGWDGQLRQPILLATERALVAIAPLEGYLHPKNGLDTLGYDQPETACRFPPITPTKTEAASKP